MKKQRNKILVVFLIFAAIALAGCGHEHTFGDWTVEKESSCIKSGVEIRFCRCGETERRDLALLDHTDGLWVTDQEPTCSASGVKHLQCAQCGTVLQTHTLEPTGHVAGDWIVDAEPTATQTGSKRQICTVCDETLETQTIPAQPSILVILDAGHGGHDPGAVVAGIFEKDINLQIAIKMKAQLESRGIKVILTREDDTFLELMERVELANNADAQLFVSIHCNSYDESADVSGLEIYYHQDKQAKSLADAILSDLAATGLLKIRSVKVGNFAVIKYTNMPAILLEMGFLTNEQERKKLCTEEYQQMLADTIASGIVRMLAQTE